MTAIGIWSLKRLFDMRHVCLGKQASDPWNFTSSSILYLRPKACLLCQWYAPGNSLASACSPLFEPAPIFAVLMYRHAYIH